jgi:Zn-finger nucleic acid-binding protein
MRLIDADALIDFIDCGHLRNPLESCFSERDVVDMLESRPTIDAVPVVRGEWFDRGSLSCRCSECGCKSNKEYTCCPNCGADMRRESEVEE